MRYCHILAFFFTLVAFISCVSPSTRAAVTAEFASLPTAETLTYVKQMTLPITYRDVLTSPLRSTAVQPLTVDQAQEDVSMFQYLLDTAYSGRDYWEMRGVDFNGIYKNLREYVADFSEQAEAGQPITSLDLENHIASLLTPIIDSHFGIMGRASHFLNRHDTAYFADILVEKQNTGYVVADSGFAGVRKGAAYTGPVDSLYRTLSPTGREHFLVGALSYNRITRLDLSFDGVSIAVPVHNCRVGSIAFETTQDFQAELLQGVPLLHVSSFEGRSPESMKSFIASGTDGALKHSAEIVLDLRENCGGVREYAEQFLSNLYQSPQFEAKEIRQFSPAIVESTLADQAFIRASAQLRDGDSTVFQSLEAKYRKTPLIERMFIDREPAVHAGYRGKVIYLINRRTGSAAEIATSFSRASKNNLIIGENSAGAMAFGNVRYYQLPHSRIVLSLPSSILIAPGFKETEGFRPDYWLDTTHPDEEVVRWLNDPAGYRFQVRQK